MVEKSLARIYETVAGKQQVQVNMDLDIRVWEKLQESKKQGMSLKAVTNQALKQFYAIKDEPETTTGTAGGSPGQTPEVKGGASPGEDRPTGKDSSRKTPSPRKVEQGGQDWE